MKTRFLTRMTLVIMGLILCLPLTAPAKEKSVIVGFHQKPGPSEQALIHEARGIIKQTYRLIPAMAVTVSEAGVEKIKKNQKVAYVEEDSTYKAVEPFIGDEYINSWGVFRIFADVAHASGNKGTGIRVAVLDTGIDNAHPDLFDNFAMGVNFVQKADGTVDHDAFLDDSSDSHGTHVAGIVAAVENGAGVIGVAPEADLYIAKVLDGGRGGLLSWILNGIQWAVENNVDIINMSFEGNGNDSLQLACEAAYNAGVLLVAAAGNLGSEVRYPAAYESVVAVAATDASDMKAFTPAGPEMELTAPGVDILSTVRVDSGLYNELSGTSQAAPHVAGVAALFYTAGILDENGNGRTNDEVREMLRTTAVDLGVPGRDQYFGFGLVNAAEASLTETMSFTIPRASGSPRLSSETVLLAGVSYDVTITNNGLSKVDVDVVENGTRRKDLSETYHFGDKKPQVVTFTLDALDKRYDVTFTPFGKQGNSADIELSVQ